jgi:hypothetical protein
MRRSNPLFNKIGLLSVIVFLGILLTITLTHRAGYVFSGNALNPDEAEFLATGKLASQDLNPYRSYATSTYGPLLIQILGVMGVLGAPLTLPWAHLLSFFFLLCILAIPLMVAFRSKNYVYLLGVVAPITLVTVSGINSLSQFRMGESDYLALNSELLPLSMISLIFYLQKRNENFKSFELLVGLFGFLASISKIQILPIFLMVTIWFYVLNIERRSAKISVKRIYVTFFALWLSFLGLLGLSSTVAAYIQQSIFASASYVSSNDSLSGVLLNVFETFHMLSSEPMILFATLSVFLVILRENFSDLGSQQRILLTLLLPFFAMVVPGTNFGHYKWLFIWTLLYLPIYPLTKIDGSSVQKEETWLGSWMQTRIAHRILLLIPIFLVAIPIVRNFDVPEKLPISQFTNLSVRPMEIQGETPGILIKGTYVSEVESLCPEGSHVLIWGWASELYSYYGWTPIPRVVNDSMRVIGSNPNSEWVTTNILEVIRDKKASCIIDASGKGFFGGKSRNQLSKNKNISKDLNANYRLVKVDDFKGRVYLPRAQ